LALWTLTFMTPIHALEERHPRSILTFAWAARSPEALAEA
jgi:hypothetical protein